VAITFVAKADTSVTAATSITLSVPSGAAAGDLLLAFIHTTGSKIVTANDFSNGANKWNHMGRQLSGGSTITSWAFWRIMQSGDTSWTFTTTASVQTQGTVLAYNESATPTWLVSNSGDVAIVNDTSALTNSAAVDAFVNDGVIVQVSFCFRSGGTVLTLTHDVGTQRVSFLNGNSNLALAVYDQINTGDVSSAFTSTATTTSSLAPGDHYAMAFTVQSTPTSDLYDVADLIDGTVAWTGYVYKGRDLAANDTTGVV